MVKRSAGKGCGASGKQFYQLSLADGCVVFLEAKYRMSRVSANKLFIHPYRTFRLIIISFRKVRGKLYELDLNRDIHELGRARTHNCV